MSVAMAVSATGLATPLFAQDSTTSHVLPAIEMHGFLQVYYRVGDPLNKDGYRLRKADVKFSGDVSPRIKWRLSFDAAKTLAVNSTTTDIADTLALSGVSIDQKSRLLQDAALTYTVSHYLAFDAGQQVIPLGLEGTTSLSNVETIERANYESERSRAVGLGDVRDLGVSASGTLPVGLEYHVGLYNEPGDDQGTTDSNDQKTIVARLAYHMPFLRGLQVGGTSGYEGGAPNQQRQRTGTEIQYRDDLFTIRGETMAARDGLLHRFGWYGLGALRPTRDVQLVARYDTWDRDLSGESALVNALERQIVVGGSYTIDHSGGKLSLNVVRQTFPSVRGIRDGTFALIAFSGVF